MPTKGKAHLCGDVAEMVVGEEEFRERLLEVLNEDIVESCELVPVEVERLEGSQLPECPGQGVNLVLLEVEASQALGDVLECAFWDLENILTEKTRNLHNGIVAQVEGFELADGREGLLVDFCDLMDIP